jgi:hypothetical protein
VQQINFRRLRGRDVYLDDSFLTGIVDQDYLVSSLRQHLLASGCILKDNREDATYVVEARAGAVGTDRHDLLYGVPATTIPTFMPIPGMPTSIPEIPLVKRTDQIGVAKLAVFAYHRESGLPYWQSGLRSETSKAKDIWILGAGPFQKGTIYEGFVFAGEEIKITNPLVRRTPDVDGEGIREVKVTQEEMFDDPLTAITMQPLPTSATPVAAAPPVAAPPPSAPPARATGPALTPPATLGQGAPPAGSMALPAAPPTRPPAGPLQHQWPAARTARIGPPPPPAVSRIPLPAGVPESR